MFRIMILLGLTFCSAGYRQVMAQETEAELAPVEIEIVREREITLPPASRYFDKIPPRPAEPIQPAINYQFKTLLFSTPQVNAVVRPLKLKAAETAEADGGFVSAGYGNFASPYAEAFITSRQNKDKLLGAHAFLNASGKGPVDGKNSGSGNSGISAFVQSFGKSISYRGEAGFENRVTHFYGYPENQTVNRDTLRQSFNTFRLQLGLTNSKNTDFSYALDGDFSYFSDAFAATESTVDLGFSGAYRFSEKNRMILEADYSIMSRKDEGIDARPRNLLQLTGYYRFTPADPLTVNVGGAIALENDTLDKKDFHFYPYVDVSYSLSPSVDVIGSVTGTMERVSLQTLARENNWISPAIRLNHSNKQVDVQAGLRARVGGNTLLSTGISLASLKNFYYFINDSVDQSKFQAVYDRGSTTRTNLYASATVTYADYGRVSLRGDYYSYATDDIVEPWHRPTYRVSLNGAYTFNKKIALRLDLVTQGGNKAFDDTADQVVKLDPAFDLNFRAEYFFSESFSVFTDFNNITSNNYQVYYRYPVRGFQGMAGITWSF